MIFSITGLIRGWRVQGTRDFLLHVESMSIPWMLMMSLPLTLLNSLSIVPNKQELISLGVNISYVKEVVFVILHSLT